MARLSRPGAVLKFEKRRYASEWCLSDSFDHCAAFQVALNYCAANNSELIVDTPIMLPTGFDPSKVIYTPDNSRATFEGAGAIFTDHNLIPCIAFLNCVGFNWKFPRLFRSGALDANYLTRNAASTWNNVNRKAWLTANKGITFTAGNPVWNGPSQAAAAFYISGSSDGELLFPKFWALDINNPQQFIPFVCSFNLDWVSNQTLTSEVVTATNAAFPKVRIVRPELRGYSMGFCGNGSIEIVEPRAYEYADYEGGGSMGGTGEWFSPGHFIYFNTDPAWAVVPNKMPVVINPYDYGIFKGSGRRPNMRLVSYKSLLGGKFYNPESERPDGLFDIGATTGIKRQLVIRNAKGTYDSSIVAAFSPVRLLGSGLSLDLDGLNLIDTAATTSLPPIASNGAAGNFDIKLHNLNINLQDWVGTTSPSIYCSGESVSIQGKIEFSGFSSTQNWLGVAFFENISSNNTKSLRYEMDIYGWRRVTDGSDAQLPRILIAPGSAGVGFGGATINGFFAEVRDMRNGLVRRQQNGLQTDEFSLVAEVTPTAGGAFTSTLVVPNGYTIKSATCWTETAITGPTSIQVGWSGTPAGLFSAHGIAFYSTSQGEFNIAVTGGNRAIIVTPVGGNFSGTGRMRIAVVATRITPAGQ